MAKEYLASMQQDDSSNSESDPGEEAAGGDRVTARLRKERLESQGKYFRYVLHF